MEDQTPPDGPYRVAVVGAGWRAEFYMRLAVALPQLFSLVGVLARRREAREAITATYGVPVYSSLDDMVHERRPDYVVVSVPRKATPALVRHLDRLGTPVLAETPPSHHECGLRGLWQSLRRPDLVQIAEQYPMMPTHQARLSIARSGVIGVATSASVSSTHDYHAIALLREYLRVGFERVRVRATATKAPLIDPRTRDGFTRATQRALATNVLATIEFGFDGDNPWGEFPKVGTYDFTTNQWHNQLRHRDLVVRGSMGEIRNESVTYWKGPSQVLNSPIIRQQSGWDLNLEGFDTQYIQFEGNVVWKNRFEGARLSDEDIAVATMMERMGRFSRGEGPSPYSLAEASQDTAIALAMHRAAETGTLEVVADEPWATSPNVGGSHGGSLEG